MNAVALVVFVIVQILFIPMALLGVVLICYKQIYISKKLGVPSTAVEVIKGRWLMHIFGLRDDLVSSQLSCVLPNNSILGLWLVFLPSYLRYRISGSTYGYPAIPSPEQEGLSDLVTARTLYIDSLIDKHRRSVEQFVCMGAGFDTRCYNMFQASEVACFELDMLKIQQLKIESLKKAGIDIDSVTFVPADFSEPGWYEKLEEAGYDPNKKTLFLWEGVTLYLDEPSVRQTLKMMKQFSARGSVLICDIYAERFVKGEYAFGMKLPQLIMGSNKGSNSFGLHLTADAKLTLSDFMASEGAVVQDTFLMGAKTEKGIFMAVFDAVLE